MACAQISKDCGFKCGKCRTVILIDNNEQIILLDTDNRESLKQKLSEKSDGLWHLQTDSLPDWVTDSINQVNVIHSLNPVREQYIKNLALVVIYAIQSLVKLDQRQTSLSQLPDKSWIIRFCRRQFPNISCPSGKK